MSTTQLRGLFEQFCEIHDEEKEKFEQFVQNVGYVQGAYDQAEGYTRLCLTTLRIYGFHLINWIFYLALNSTVFEEVTLKIKKNFMREVYG